MVEKIMDSISKYKKLEGKEVSILFVDNDYMQELNKTYRDIDKPTDVLSFSQFDEDSPQITPQPIGDIVISLEKARENMAVFENTFDGEIIRLLTHGTLHLLGYDHEEEAQREVMEAEEMAVIENIPDIIAINQEIT